MWKWEWICWFVNLISREPSKRVRRYRRLIERLSREADIDDGWWNVYRDYPKHGVISSAFVAEGHNGPPNEQTAIVIQGPFVERDSLTFNTISLYRRTMPNARLILSTWDDLSSENQSAVESLDVRVVTGSPPEIPGPQNLNCQILSTRRGIEEAKRLGCVYTMKTRTDTRIHMPGPDRFCRDLLTHYPVAASTTQTKRIIVLDFATRLYVPYHPSDIMMFGATDDLLQYWSRELCGPDLTFEVRKEFDAMLRQATPEVVMCRDYIRRTGEQVDHDLRQWWRLLADRFLVIDRDMIDLFWPKYNYNVDQRLGMTWDTSNMALCHFAHWMQIYSGNLMPDVTLDDLRGQSVHDKCGQAAA